MPCGIVHGSNTGTLYIADNINHRVMSYASGASTGTLVASGNGPGTNNTQLWYPFGLYFNSISNSLAITSTSAHNVVQWVLGVTSWTLLAGSINGSSGNTSTLLNTPHGITFNPMGNIYILLTRIIIVYNCLCLDKQME